MIRMRAHDGEFGQRSGRTATRTRAKSDAATQQAEHPLLALQRSAGNKAVTGLVAAAQDSAAESEADRVAVAAASSLTGIGASNSAAAIAAGAGRLPAPLQTALGPLLGDTASVGIDSGPGSERANDGMGARAFARPGHIHLGAGERTSPDAPELVLHEAVHAVRHRAAEHDAGGRTLVHAKLKGTRDALLAQGGQKSSGFLRGLAAEMGAKGALTKWDQLLSTVAVYEGAEGKLVAKNPGPREINQAKPMMLQLLGGIEGACTAWQSSNEGDRAEQQAELMQGISTRKVPVATNSKWGKKKKAKWSHWLESENEQKQTDVRSKAPRRQSIAMLLPRVRRETEDWKADRWAQNLGLSSANLTGRKDVEEKGQMNDAVEQVTYDVTGTSFKGFFKPEKGFENMQAGQDLQSGIRQADPNYGARAVAMYRLDQLLATGVIARAEFAIHNGKLGVVTEKAKGTQGTKADIKISASEGARSGQASLEDPVLQRCLNKLQIIDAIAGQLDRHQGNYFIQTDAQGKVTGVTGIDLDMAFGKDMTDAGIGSKPGAAAFYAGIPTLVDYDLGQRLIQLTEDQIEGAIKGLLSDAEVQATKARFRQVRQHALILARSGQLTQQWNAQTSRVDRPQEATTWRSQTSDFKSYGAHLANQGALKGSTSFEKPISRALAEDSPFHSKPWYRELHNELEPSQKKAISDACSSTQLQPLIQRAIMMGSLGVDEAESRAGALVDDMFSDHAFWNKVIIATQENDDLGPIIKAKASWLLSIRRRAN